MIRGSLKSVVATMAASVAMVTVAQAGGFDRGGVNIDLLFDESRFATEAAVTYVTPQREIQNVQRGANEATQTAISSQLAPIVGAAGATATQAEINAFIAANPPVNGAIVQNVSNAVIANFAGAGLNPGPATTASIDVDSDYAVPRLGAKVTVIDNVDCLASYTEPFGADADYGTGHAYSASAVKFSIDTNDYGLTCSYKFSAGETSLGKAQFRIIGGVSYQELDGFQSRQRFLDFANLGLATIGGVTNTAGVGSFSVDGDAWGWRIGAAYEIPDIALRAQLIYSSKYEYDLTGIQDNRGFGAVIPGTGVVPISLTTEIPQSLEFKLQSGIAPGTLAFFNVKWQEWSKLGIIPIVGGRSPVTGQPTNLSFDPLYQDGWTITGGLGRQFTEQWSGVFAVTWDRGTSTTSGTQTDTWTFSGGVSYNHSESVELRLGGALGVLTSGTSVPTGGDAANNVSYSFGNDLVAAISGAVRIKF